MTLEAKLKVIRAKLDKGSKDFPNEAAVSQGIVLPILRELDWDTDDPMVVRPEYAAGKGRADFVLCDGNGNPKVIIEVKRLGAVKKLGTAKEGEGQGVQYAHSTRAPIIVLTNGKTWSFCLLEQGDFGHELKRVYEIDVSSQESSEVLQRYLERDRVVEDEALETARVIFFLKKYLKNKPDVWKGPVNNAVTFLRELPFLAIPSEEKINPKSAQDDIVDYFHSLLRERISPSPSGETIQRPQPELGKQVSAPAKLEPMTMTSAGKQSESERQASTRPEQKVARVRGSNVRIKLVIFRRRYRCRSQSHAMAIVFKQLQKEDARFLQRFYKLPRNQREGGRRYLGRNLQELFGNNVGRKSKEPVGRGWVISTNYSWPGKKEMIQLAAQVAGLELKLEEDISGKGIIVNLDKKT